jgi:SNF2 family DNA or RNA helicase
LVQAIRSKARGGNPQVIKRDSDGNPVFRNLERLRALMSPHTYRVLKKECLDLPEKIYNTHYFELSPSQQKLYDKVKEESRYTKEDGEIDLYSALTLINKLRQITSGFIIADNAPVTLPEAQPRLEALAQLVASTEGQIIIWASFVEEIAQIAQALSDQTIVQYYGAISDADRELAVDKFQRGEARIFLANPAVGGTGLTLTAADAVIYYSNSYNLGQRLQSEDRAHRIGTRHNVVYTDLVATGTIDERIASALQTKNLVASYVLDGKVN